MEKEMNEIPKDIFHNINKFLNITLFDETEVYSSPSPFQPKPLPKKETVSSFPYWFDPERVHEIIYLYCTGMPIMDIAHWVGFSPDETNMIIDHYAPYL